MVYREDIDGLRAIAVIAVIIFHLGYLSNGYLGVDVFFAISGFLITTIIYQEAQSGSFSIVKFYERRLRRIIPLLLSITLIGLVLGFILMLPEELENLSQSVVASNFSINNVLMYLTSGNYWATKNEYKPLMHTWSLGVEEQFYLLYPLIFLFFQKERIKSIIYIIGALTILSVTAVILNDSAAAGFYLIQYRFFELSIGGLGAIILLKRLIVSTPKTRMLLNGFVVLLVVFIVAPLPRGIFLNLAVTIVTTGILVIGGFFNGENNLYTKFFQNKLIVGIGRISFSLYMWHQLVFAFARYSFVEHITAAWSLALVLLVIVLSILTFYFIEKPFRNRNLIPTGRVLIIVAVLFVISTVPAFYFHLVNGVVRDFPELGLSVENRTIKKNIFISNRNDYIKYNDDVKKLNVNFTTSEKKKVLVIGNSFGRDMVNVLSEYDENNSLELRYYDIDKPDNNLSLRERILDSDYIFIAAKDFLDLSFLKEFENKNDIRLDQAKVWVFGTKNFGYTNGIHHFQFINNNIDYESYSTVMKDEVDKVNNLLKAEWGDKFIDLISLVKLKNGEVLVYTQDGKFISHDTLHLTRFGAKLFADRLKDRLDLIFKN